MLSSYLFIFLLGTLFGSFVNVLIDRVPRNQNIFISRSHCDHCKKTLSWYELIPIFSYLFLQGKCSKCKKDISPRNVIVEVITGLMFVALTMSLYLSTSLYVIITMLLVLCILLAIFYIDLDHGIIPDQLLIVLLLLAFFLHIEQPMHNIVSYLFIGICSLLFFLFIYVITREKGMGFGDVKFPFGPFLVTGIIVAIFLGGKIINEIPFLHL